MADGPRTVIDPRLDDRPVARWWHGVLQIGLEAVFSKAGIRKTVLYAMYQTWATERHDERAQARFWIDLYTCVNRRRCRERLMGAGRGRYRQIIFPARDECIWMFEDHVSKIPMPTSVALVAPLNLVIPPVVPVRAEVTVAAAEPQLRSRAARSRSTADADAIYVPLESLPRSRPTRPRVSTSRMTASEGEEAVKRCLEANDIPFRMQTSLIAAMQPGVVGGGGLTFDFYVPDIRLAIEFDGKQHREPVEYFGGIQGFLDTLRCDDIKHVMCLEHRISLLRLTDDDLPRLDHVVLSTIRVIRTVPFSALPHIIDPFHAERQELYERYSAEIPAERSVERAPARLRQPRLSRAQRLHLLHEQSYQERMPRDIII
jgi:hypothetical protein